ncbi:hypothetical protein NA57DRAFT_76021 [Rhizodiscina lignyota]|uniref:F-box domain-containing protein n=1 Tax=Rhizodiscina lignyota TaxID=1504668 RepID=A0A9P4IFN2_9PEZI|nr:hypothetical protein NA57DRAFT_76021 [Rhizodiscina lignyota]
MEGPKGHAGCQVFETFELVELILSHLTLLEILRAEPTSRSISSVIHSSPTLKRRLHFSQPRNGDINRCMDCYGTPVPRHDIPSDAFIPYAAFSGPMTTFIDATLLNPLLPRIFPCHRTNPLEHGWLLLVLRDLPDLPDNSRPSWASMLFTAQPVKKLRIEPATMLRESPNSCAPIRLPPPDPAEADRIAALHARLSTTRTRTDLRPAEFPVNGIRRLAAARGEASADGWVWGSSLDLVRGKKPKPGYEKSLLVNEDGVRIGQIEEVARKAKWNTWVLKKLE